MTSTAVANRSRENLRPPFEPGNQAAVKHGVDSEARIRPVARTQKRRLLRQIGLASSDLDGIGRALLDNWARAQAKVEILDRWSAENGFLDPRGSRCQPRRSTSRPSTQPGSR